MRLRLAISTFRCDASYVDFLRVCALIPIGSFSSTWKKTNQSRHGVTGFRRPCSASPGASPCRIKHAETHPPRASHQRVQTVRALFPIGSVMLGAKQRDETSAKIFIKQPPNTYPKRSALAGETDHHAWLNAMARCPACPAPDGPRRAPDRAGRRWLPWLPDGCGRARSHGPRPRGGGIH